MSDNNDRLYQKLDNIDQRLDNVDVTMARNTVLLDEHIKRTNLLEAEIKPIKRHMDMVNLLAKLMSGALGLLLAARQLGLI